MPCKGRGGKPPCSKRRKDACSDPCSWTGAAAKAKKPKAAPKKTPVAAKKPKVCTDGTLLNPATQRCIKDTAANRRRLGMPLKSQSRTRATPKPKKSCKVGYTFNAKTGECEISTAPRPSSRNVRESDLQDSEQWYNKVRPGPSFKGMTTLIIPKGTVIYRAERKVATCGRAIGWYGDWSTAKHYASLGAMGGAKVFAFQLTKDAHVIAFTDCKTADLFTKWTGGKKDSWEPTRQPIVACYDGKLTRMSTYDTDRRIAKFVCKSSVDGWVVMPKTMTFHNEIMLCPKDQECFPLRLIGYATVELPTARTLKAYEDSQVFLYTPSGNKISNITSLIPNTMSWVEKAVTEVENEKHLAKVLAYDKKWPIPKKLQQYPYFMVLEPYDQWEADSPLVATRSFLVPDEIRWDKSLPREDKYGELTYSDQYMFWAGDRAGKLLEGRAAALLNHKPVDYTKYQLAKF